jgi:hypothetical protein
MLSGRGRAFKNSSSVPLFALFSSTLVNTPRFPASFPLIAHFTSLEAI